MRNFTQINSNFPEMSVSQMIYNQSCIKISTYGHFHTNKNLLVFSFHQEFFKDLAQYEEKHKLLNESANFLIEVTTDPIGDEIKQTVLSLNRRYTELVEGFHDFRQNEVIGKARVEYEAGVSNLEGWLNYSNGIINQDVKCIHADLKAYLLELDVSIISYVISLQHNFSVDMN